MPVQLKFLFGVIFFTNLMVNMDHGIFPACTEEVRRDIGIPNTQLGIMGSIVYLGLVVGKPDQCPSFAGSMCAIPVLNNMNTKFVMTICLLANAASLFLFTISSAYEVYLLSRFLVGFFQVRINRLILRCSSVYISLSGSRFSFRTPNSKL